jgi:2'-hydroxyisoflavone reductase
MLIGDREDNLTALENREWDVVIDNSGRNVGWTTRTAELLKDKVGLYLYTSSTSVYFPYLGENFDETMELLTVEPAETENEDEKMEYWYGVMKTNSEIAVKKAFGEDRTIVVRPTYMIGPGDKSDRFIYWPVRLPRGGEIMLPGKADDPMQYIDVRNVAEWMIRLAEEKRTGTFNAVGPEEPETNAEFGQQIVKIFDVESTLVQVDDYDFLIAENIPYLVPWVPPTGKNYGSSLVSNKKSLAAGLTSRSLAASIKDTHDWWYSDALTEERRQEFEGKENGLLAREGAILTRWKELEG